MNRGKCRLRVLQGLKWKGCLVFYCARESHTHENQDGTWYEDPKVLYAALTGGAR